MATRFKATDTPTLETNIEDIDLTDADRVRILVDHPEDDVLIVDDTATIDDAAQGLVEYAFSQAQTARSGTHRVEYVVEYSDDSQLSYPPDGFIRLNSEEPLDREADVDEVEADQPLSLSTLYADALEANTGSSVSVQSDLDHGGNDVSNVGSFSTGEVDTEHARIESEGATDVIDDAAYTWYMNPRAIDGGGKTFVGGVSKAGDIVVGSYDHQTGDTVQNTLNAGFQQDDHAAPGLAIDGNGIVYAFWSEHDGTSQTHWTKSTSAHDISSVEAEKTISTSSGLEYCNPRVVSGRIYLFYQPTGNHYKYIYSDDGGSTWSSVTEWLTVSNGGAYVQLDQPDDNGRMHFCAGITTGGSMPLQDVYHGYWQDGTVYTSDGTSLGSTVDITDLTQIYDSSATGNHEAAVFDCAKVDGTPQILFGTYKNRYDDHEYRYAAYDGGSWSHEKLVDGGGPITKVLRNQWSYSGLAYLDRTEYGVAFAAIGDDHSSRLVRLQTQDNGQTWSSETWTDSSAQNVRPVCPHSPSGNVPVAWMRGRYHQPSGAYQTSIRVGREPVTGADNAGDIGAWTVATMSSNQSVGANNTMRATFDDTRDDIRQEFDTTNNEFVASEYGLYQVEATVTFAATSGIASGQCMALLSVGGFRKDADYQEIIADTAISLHVSATYYLYEGDTAYLEVRQESDSTVDIDSPWNRTNFEVTQLR